MYGIIYKVTNLINGKVYIGLTTRLLRERFASHLCVSLSNKKDIHCKFHNAIRKYGKENFKIEQIDSADSKEELDKKEIYWISYYNSIENGYNMKEGGFRGVGYKHSKETRQKISDMNRKRVYSEQARKNMSIAQKKVKHHPASEETKKKMSETRKGHITTQETRNKISKSNSGKIRTEEMNKANRERQLGKTFIHNKVLNINIIAFKSELQAFLEKGWEIGKGENTIFIKKKDFYKLYN